MTALRKSVPPPRRLVEGDLVLAEADFRRLSRLLHETTGIFLPDSKATLVYSRLAKRMRSMGLSAFADYCDLVEGERGAEERQRMILALTTNVTSFLREPHHFDALRNKVLPPLLARARAGGRVRIWSAGCSRGHEPYSIAMTVLGLMPNAADHDIRILATDIDTDVLAEGARGRYDAEALAPISRPDLTRFFTPNGGSAAPSYDVNDEMRRLVTFRTVNLIAPWPMKGLFDIIVCRNVVIYFDDATQDKVWRRFGDVLVPGGFLFIGHSERLSASAEPYFEGAGITAYRRRGEGRA